MTRALDAILALARRHGLRVVEDAAHAFPTSYRGRAVGTLDSDATVFSIYANNRANSCRLAAYGNASTHKYRHC